MRATTDAQSNAEAPPAAQLSEIGSEAAALYASGDVAGAIARLESADSTARTVVDQSLLGALYFESGRINDAWSMLAPLAQRADADAAVLYQAGRAALALGRQRVGVGLLERAARLVPQSPAARELGFVAGKTGQFEQAFDWLQPWALSHPDDLDAARAAAAAALQIDRLRDAELFLRALPDSEPRATILRGQLALRSGRPQEAIDALSGLMDEHSPEIDVDLRRLLADGYIQTGRSGEAIPLTEPCSRYEPRCALLLAEARYRSGEISAALEAIATHADAALKDPESVLPEVRARLLQMQGRLMVAAARYDDAMPFLQLASELLPDEPASWKSLGDAFSAVGQRDKALHAMERFRTASEAADQRRRRLDAARRDPVHAALEDAERLLAAGRGEAAVAVVRREISLDPRNLVVRLAEVQMLLHMNQLDEALAAAEATVTAFPIDADARYTRGVVHMARREMGTSEADFVATLDLAPGHVPALNDLAVLLMVSGRREKAREFLERALALKPDDPLAKRNLESLAGETPP